MHATCDDTTTPGVIYITFSNAKQYAPLRTYDLQMPDDAATELPEEEFHPGPTWFPHRPQRQIGRPKLIRDRMQRPRPREAKLLRLLRRHE